MTGTIRGNSLAGRAIGSETDLRHRECIVTGRGTAEGRRGPQKLQRQLQTASALNADSTDETGNGAHTATAKDVVNGNGNPATLPLLLQLTKHLRLLLPYPCSFRFHPAHPRPTQLPLQLPVILRPLRPSA